MKHTWQNRTWLSPAVCAVECAACGMEKRTHKLGLTLYRTRYLPAGSATWERHAGPCQALDRLRRTVASLEERLAVHEALGKKDGT